MANPVTGPYFKSRSTGKDYIFGFGYRQARPLNMVLPYRIYRDHVEGAGFSVGGTDPNSSVRWALHNDSARNQAYEKLQSAIKHSAQWGETLVQLGQTRAMLVNRVMQFTSFASALKKGKFRKAANILRTPTPKKVSKKKAFADNFLEYQMGWKPLVSDIYSTLEFFSSPLKGYKCYGRGSSWWTDLVYSKSSTGKSFVRDRTNSTARWQMGAYVAVTNPNLYLLNSMGLINPVATAWQAATLSFVVDWFVNVEQMLLSMSDYVGLRLDMPYMTESRSWDRDRLAVNSESDDPDFHWIEHAIGCGSAMQRYPGNPSPVVNFKPFKGFGISRGATAVALLLQKLR